MTDIGSLVSDSNSRLEAIGRWTTEDCDSRFLTDSDAHYYQFQLAEAGQVRIDLSSDEGDAYVHLLTENGSRLAHDDDSGPGLDARIERDLTPGVYLV